ncbi:MAG TPA: response regulator [Azospirillum sp.]|nr:response regulator [Azospirillum sp.]
MPEPFHVLVAEDEPLAAMAIEDFLSRKGYRVTLAVDGVDAMERQSADPADIILTDLRMPRMDGKRLIRELRAVNPKLPVVIMTGYLSFGPEDEDLTGDAGQSLEVLRKPVSPQVILDTLERLLTKG